eukprot:TRINITY_DN35604_c0_g1_i1.p2 TRINITY_DN35604_c0_g1~~TRINITY_DN35604_c0_g1_i1.p2  ORF type:complete len:158 (+),score=15.31 TRINITY_DN35604_c0_g1_i1:146-619(+)
MAKGVYLMTYEQLAEKVDEAARMCFVLIRGACTLQELRHAFEAHGTVLEITPTRLRKKAIQKFNVHPDVAAALVIFATPSSAKLARTKLDATELNMGGSSVYLIVMSMEVWGMELPLQSSQSDGGSKPLIAAKLMFRVTEQADSHRAGRLSEQTETS